jgi:hypothetical protein
MDRLQHDYESPFPECKVAASVDEFAMIRLDMNRDQAALFAKQVNESVEEHDDPEELVELSVTMSPRTAKEFAEQIGRILEAAENHTVSGPEEIISAQVLIDRELDPNDDGVSVAVISNESQVRGTYESAQKVLATGAGLRWEFTVSPAGAEMLVQQLVGAIKGADDPLDRVDPDDLQFDGGDR